MIIAERVKKLEEDLLSIDERLSDVRVTHSIKHNILSATHEDTIVAALVNNDILHYSAGDWQKTDSPSLADLTIGTPVNIYALSHDSFADFVANEHIDHTAVSVSAGTGLTGGGTIAANRTISLSHLGIQNLTDPGADRIVFWDETAGAMKWLSLGTSLNIVLTVMNTIQDIRTTASPTFAGATLSDNLIFSGAAVRQILHSVDNQAIYVGAGSSYAHGASIQFYGEDHGVYPGSAYIVSGSHDASPASIIEFAYRNAGAYQAIMRLGADRHVDIWDWDDSVMREISFGADDSMGAGFKGLRVPN